MSDPLDDIYSPENIARSRDRAAGIRAAVARGELEPTWLGIADEMDAYATEREGHSERERELAARELHHFETEMENDRLRNYPGHT